MNNTEKVLSAMFSTIQTDVVDSAGVVSKGEQRILHEHALSLYVNGDPVRELICTKEYLQELVIGNLYTSGFFHESLPEITISESGDRADAWITADMQKERQRNISLPNVPFDINKVFQLIGRFEEGMTMHKLTRGTHCSILACNGKIVFAAEDIGRHNALDKAVGYMVLQNLPAKSCMLYTSGRIPIDMVEKVIMAGIPFLVSKAIPTAESVQLAKEHGLTLIIRAWPDHFEIVR